MKDKGDFKCRESRTNDNRSNLASNLTRSIDSKYALLRTSIVDVSQEIPKTEEPQPVCVTACKSNVDSSCASFKIAEVDSGCVNERIKRDDARCVGSITDGEKREPAQPKPNNGAAGLEQLSPLAKSGRPGLAKSETGEKRFSRVELCNGSEASTLQQFVTDKKNSNQTKLCAGSVESGNV